jgi:ATP-dependent Clp protease ATP-binding subunit ClpC
MIVDIQTRLLLKRLGHMDITIELTKSAKEFLTDKGYDPVFGARPLKRAMQKFLEDPFAEEMLKGRFGTGSKIKARFNKKAGELRFVDTTKKEESTGEDAHEEEKSPELPGISAN